ncbi:MAG: DinB family protein [Acidobacteriota bacterium]
MGQEELGRAFLQQAQDHLSTDFMPKIEKCVQMLDEQEIWWRAHESNNSVGNLLLHLSGNVRQWIISGLGGAPDRRERSLEFSERGPAAKIDLWRGLKATVEDAGQVLRDFPPDRLLEVRRIQGYSKTALQAVFHVVEHFSFHTGQIVYIAKLKKGMDLKFYNL